MNEGVYRSPKWLRKFLDYEIHTGEDIKGKVSKREIRAREKAEADRIKREWNNRWDNMDKGDFKKFYKEEFPSEVKYQYNDYIYSSDLEKIRSKWQNNPEIWVRFDKWVEKKREEEAKQQRLKIELDELWNSIMRDFYSNPYSDKIETKTEKGSVRVFYTFENGKKLEMWENELTFGNIIYTLGLIYRNKFVTLINKMIGDMKSRPGYRKSSYSSSTNTNRNSNKSEEEISSIYEVLERIDDYMKSKRWTLCRINTKDITDGKSVMKLTSGMKSIDWKTQLFVTLYSSNKVTLYYKPM